MLRKLFSPGRQPWSPIILPSPRNSPPFPPPHLVEAAGTARIAPSCPVPEQTASARTRSRSPSPQFPWSPPQSPSQSPSNFPQPQEAETIKSEPPPRLLSTTDTLATDTHPSYPEAPSPNAPLYQHSTPDPFEDQDPEPSQTLPQDSNTSSHTDNSHPQTTTPAPMPSPLPVAILRLHGLLTAMQSYYYIHGPADFSPTLLSNIETYRPKLLAAKKEWERVQAWEDKLDSGVRRSIAGRPGVFVTLPAADSEAVNARHSAGSWLGSGLAGTSGMSQMADKRASKGSLGAMGDLRGAMDEGEFEGMMRGVLDEVVELILEVEEVFELTEIVL
ncbi:hypothetical protein NX059_002821 [Plenodomus lindquistii]|nr:hypothetical protein NX059_002821 [Plenodomus lindquistii]